MNFQPLWWDEGYSVWFATQSVSQMLALTAQDIHPPLYYALLHGWTVLFGAGPVALRLLSVSIGTLTIPLLYLAARRILAPRGALLAAALLAINPLHVYYSQEIRMYGLVALLSTALLAAAWCVMDQRSRGAGEQGSQNVSVPPHLHAFAPLLLYVLLTTAALYTQYYAIFLPIGLTLYALWRWRRDRRSLLTWLAAQLAVAVLYLPWVVYAAPKLVLYVSQKVVADADKPLGPLMYLARHLAAFLAGHLEGPLAPWWPAALVLLVPLAIGWWLAARGRGEGAMQRDRLVAVSPRPRVPVSPRQLAVSSFQPRASSFLLIMLLTALTLGWLIGLRYPFFPVRGERLLLLALPPFVLLAAGGLDALRRRWRAAGLITLALVVAISVASLAAFYTVPRYRDDDYRSLINHTVEQGLPSDMVFAVYPWQVGYWRSYGSPAGPAAILTPDTAWSPAVSEALDAALARGRVWFPAHLALGAILETEIEAHLVSQAVPFVNEWHGPNTRLSAWAGAATTATNFTQEAPGTGLPVRFALPGGEMLVLQAVSGSTAPMPAANAVTPVALAWQADAAPPVLAVSVRLTDDLGQIWAQHDYEPLGGAAANWTRIDAEGRGQAGATDRLGLLIPAGTPPGHYIVRLLLRSKGSERPLEAIGADGGSLGTSVPLFGLEVAPTDQPLGPERLPIATRQEAGLGDGLRFLGFSTDETALTPGDLRKVSLFWEANSRPTSDYTAFVQVLGRDGAPVALWEAPPGAAYPTSQWAAGTLMRTQASFRIPASVSDGRYRLIAGLFRASDKAVLRTAAGADHLDLGMVTVRGRPHDLTPPQAEHPADTTFGAVARLLGYDLAAAEVQPGGAFTLTLHWQALASADRPYTAFVHLVDGGGVIRGYGDSEPGGGAFPTPGWLAGEYLADVHTVSVAAGAPVGTYQIEVGFYDPASGERLRTPDGADRVVLGTLVVIK